MWELESQDRGGARGLVLPLLAPVIVLAFDWWSHPLLFRGYGKRAFATYVGTALLSVAMWWAWASLIAHRTRAARLVGTIVVVVGGAVIVGGQRYVVDRFGVLIDETYLRWGTSKFGSASTVLWNDRWTIVRAAVPPLLAFVGLAVALWRLRRTMRAAPMRVAAPVAAITTVVTVRFASPSRHAEGAEPLDVLALSAMGVAARANLHGATSAGPGRRSPKPVPVVARAAGTLPRNVVLLLTESVRAENSCLDVRSGCAEIPFSHRAAPDRVIFQRMHSLASNTTPSVTAMWTGLSPASTREALHSAPLVWEYAQAAGYDTTYWTSQDLSFANHETFLLGIPARLRVSAADLDVERDSLVGADERLLAMHIEAHLGELREPFFAAIHLSNTHMPYRVDADDLPWLPESTEGMKGNEALVMNRYRDAIYAQDKVVGRLLRGFRGLPSSSRTVVIFTSDHGEQFREHGALGHSQSLSEPEVHVPFWIDAPPETLTAEERANLLAAADRPLTHAMFLPTVLDLMGIYDASEIAPLRAEMPGASLLRAAPSLPAIVLTNCSGMSGCPRPTWGAMKGGLKVWANDDDRSWNCHDLIEDPREQRHASGAECDELALFAEGAGRGVPFRTLR